MYDGVQRVIERNRDEDVRTRVRERERERDKIKINKKSERFFSPKIEHYFYDLFFSRKIGISANRKLYKRLFIIILVGWRGRGYAFFAIIFNLKIKFITHKSLCLFFLFLIKKNTFLLRGRLRNRSARNSLDLGF